MKMRPSKVDDQQLATRSMSQPELSRESSRSKFQDRIASARSTRNGLSNNKRCLGKFLSKEDFRLQSNRVQKQQIKFKTTTTMRKSNVNKSLGSTNPIAFCVCLAVILTTPTALHNVSFYPSSDEPDCQPSSDNLSN